MLMFDNEPADWRDLQNLVAQMFSEMGADVFVGERVKLVRGAKEIDVRVVDKGTVPPSVYLCECKFWRNAVPQEVVHAFRTVMGDFGAHRGFLISREGFQAGAFEAAGNTNLNLVTFPELQELFFDRWIISVSHRFMPYADRLFPYWDPAGGKAPQVAWGNEDFDRFRRLNDAYLPFIELGPCLEMRGFEWRLPMAIPAVNHHGEVDGEITIASHRQLFNFLDANKDIAHRHYQRLFGEIAG